ncbi:MAG TPA: hypothetical protein VFX30_05165 [bacterium]|nr:hypothetical protein [bacterium]
MDPVHLHLMLCHVPVVGQAIAFAGLVVAFFKKDASFRRWALGLSFATALTALPATWSGEGSEDRAASLTGVSMDAMEAHEEAAETALAVTLGAGGAAALALILIRTREKAARIAVAVAAAASLVALGYLAKASNLGGGIRHPEVRSAPGPQ